MNIIYIVIDKNKDNREVSNIVAVCSEYDIAYEHLIDCRESVFRYENHKEYEIICLSLHHVDKLIGAVNYLKNKIKENINEQKE